MKNLKFKRIIAMVMCMALVGNLAMSGETRAAENDFVIQDGVLTAYKGNEKNVVIPDGVKKIGKRAFENKEKVETVVIPKGVTEIGAYAFMGSGLKEVVVPNGVTKMGNWALACNKLQSVKLPGSLKKVSENAFETADIKEIVIPKGCKEIGARAFWFCTKLKKVTIPEGVKKIGEGAFKDTAIKKITIPKSVKKLGNKNGVFTYAETKQSIREVTILNPKLKVKYMFGTEPLNKAGYLKYKKEWTFGLVYLDKTVTIKGYKNSTAEKFVKDIKKNKKKYIQSLKFRALKK